MYDRSVKQTEPNPGVPEELDVRLKCGAHHEAGHMVIAAAQGLRLRPEGLMLDASGDGVAWYHKQPDGSDLSRERIIVATLAGFRAENRFREERSYRERGELEVTLSPDGREARKLLMELQGEYFSNERKQGNRLDSLIEQHWLTIKALATALLAKNPEPLQPLKSGATWSHQKTARYLVGNEVVSILVRCGIVADRDPDR